MQNVEIIRESLNLFRKPFFTRNFHRKESQYYKIKHLQVIVYEFSLNKKSVNKEEANPVQTKRFSEREQEQPLRKSVKKKKK